MAEEFLAATAGQLGDKHFHRLRALYNLARCRSSLGDAQGAVAPALQSVDGMIEARGANLSGADLTDANLCGADLARTRGLTPEQVDTANFDGATRLPPAVKTRKTD